VKQNGRALDHVHEASKEEGSNGGGGGNAGGEGDAAASAVKAEGVPMPMPMAVADEAVPMAVDPPAHAPAPASEASEASETPTPQPPKPEPEPPMAPHASDGAGSGDGAGNGEAIPRETTAPTSQATPTPAPAMATLKEETLGGAGTGASLGSTGSAVLTTLTPVGGAAGLSLGQRVGVLPEPTPIPVQAAPCLRGKLTQMGNRHVCKGVWAMKRDDHFGGFTSKFEFSIKPPVTPGGLGAAPLPADGHYSGFFWMADAKGGSTKVEDNSDLVFTANACGGWNLTGRGGNRFGQYSITGTVSADLELELFRHFDHLTGGGGSRDRRSSGGGHRGRTSHGGEMHPPGKNRSSSFSSVDSGYGGHGGQGHGHVTQGGWAPAHLQQQQQQQQQYHVPPPISTAGTVTRETSFASASGAQSVGSANDSALTPLSSLTDASAGLGLGLGLGLGPLERDTSYPSAYSPARPAPGQGQDGSSPVEAAEAASVRLDRIMGRCMDILTRLMKAKEGFLFNEPVDPVKAFCPDYYHVIKQPMDFGTIRSRLESSAYTSHAHFANDVRQVFINAVTYNALNTHPVNQAARLLHRQFEERYTQQFRSGPVGLTQPFVLPDFSSRVAGLVSGAGGGLGVAQQGAGAGAGAGRPMRNKRQRSLNGDDSYSYDDLDDMSGSYAGESWGGASAAPSQQQQQRARQSVPGGANRAGAGAGADAANKRQRGSGGGEHALLAQALKRIGDLEEQVKRVKPGPGVAMDMQPLSLEEKRNLRISIENLPPEKTPKVSPGSRRPLPHLETSADGGVWCGVVVIRWWRSSRRARRWT
jgi:hypothetical protein